MSRSGEFFIFAPSTIESALGRKTRGKDIVGEEKICICRGDMVMQPHAPLSKMCVKKRVFLCNGGGSCLKMSSFRSSFDMLRYDYGLVNYSLLSNLEIGQCR